mmetsp:Transcript_29792/g.28955  ORF Transcript_29792/g.28955 Transcript_29792/m.28955 type:complete len:207 (-) Transcript_29792:299-919(-)
MACLQLLKEAPELIFIASGLPLIHLELVYGLVYTVYYAPTDLLHVEFVTEFVQLGKFLVPQLLLPLQLIRISLVLLLDVFQVVYYPAFELVPPIELVGPRLHVLHCQGEVHRAPILSRHLVELLLLGFLFLELLLLFLPFELVLQTLHVVDNVSVLSSHHSVLNQDPGDFVVIFPQLPIEDIIIKLVEQGDPVHEGLAGSLNKFLH